MAPGRQHIYFISCELSTDHSDLMFPSFEALKARY